jgi:hypothetical protein
MPKTSSAGTRPSRALNSGVRLVLMLPIVLLLLGPEGESCTPNPATPCISDGDCVVEQVCIDNRCTEPPACVCTDVYQPVCGVDAKTYGNACEASCQGVEVAHEGECGGSACTDNGDCQGELICYPPSKTCEPSCTIACFAYDPVCGTDAVTYGCGEQDAWCHGVEVAHRGECGVCVCTREYAPVCGVDGLTYGNACNARCAGVDVQSEGPCPDAGKPCTPEECGPGLGAPNFLCEDGTIGGPGPCVRNDAGLCAWTYVNCPAA